MGGRTCRGGTAGAEAWGEYYGCVRGLGGDGADAG